MNQETNETAFEQDGFDIPESRLRRLARAVRPLGYAAAFLAAFFALRWLADAFRYAPQSMLLITVGAVAVARFVFKPPWHHAVILAAAAALLYYPVQLVLFCSRFFVIPFLIIAMMVIARGLSKKYSWPRMGYTVVAVFMAGMLVADMLGPLFMFSERRITAPGLRALGGGELKDVNIENMLLSGNDRKLFISFERDGKRGMAAIPIQPRGRVLFRAFGGGGIKLLSQDESTGNLYAADQSRGALYELDYDTLKTVKTYDMTRFRFPSAVFDRKGNQIVVADTRKDSIKVFRTSDPGMPWFTSASGEFGFRLFPNIKEQKLPGLSGVSRLIADRERRRLYVVYGSSRNLVVMGLDDRRILKIERGVSAGAAAAAVDEKHGTLMLANPYGFVDFYDGERLRMLRRVWLRRSMRSVDYDPGRDMAVAGGYSDGRVYFMERATGRVAARPYICVRIRNLAVSRRTGRVYLTCEDGVFEVDPKKFGIQ